ncbi:MAG: 1-acyl-sn-glycerol-3-phosphate acyltransferase [Caulobacteraceae bacterium]|nr:1-acyl-sn-glycerol-3-phosphate acyltransferase [Caulobacteraceae bacterium]
MTAARSLAFVALFYLWSAIVAIAILPLLLAPRGWMLAATRLWADTVIALLAAICGVRVEVRGRRHLAAGPALIGAKHQCMFDTWGCLSLFADACFVMKKELVKIPFFGWYSWKSDMIVVDREGGAKALRKLLADARARAAQGRQVVIFPEGSRTAPGETGDYKPGIAALYRDLGLACTPMATNSGVHWPAHGFLRRPGTIVYEFLSPIPPGLSRREFMRVLEERLEGASTALLGE